MTRHGPVDVVPLVDALNMMVPFAMAEMRHLTPGQLAARASRAAVAVGTHGDSLQFYSEARASGQRLKGAALGVAGLADGIAAAELLHPGSGRAILNRLAPPKARPVSRPSPVDDGPWWGPLAELERLLGIDPPATQEPAAPVAVDIPPLPAPRPVVTINLPLFALETEVAS